MGGLRGVVMMQTSGFARARRLKRIRHCRSSEARRPSREAARSLNRTASLSAIGFLQLPCDGNSRSYRSV